MAEPTPPTDPTEPTTPAGDPVAPASVDPASVDPAVPAPGEPGVPPAGYAAPDAASLQAGYLPPAPGSEYAAQQPAPVKKKTTRWVVLSIVIAVVVAAAVGIGTTLVLRTVNAANSPAAISRTVDQLKAQYDLPQQIDEVTTLDDITAEGSDIHYHYTIAGADTTGLTEQALADSILPQLCAQKATRDVLDNDIGMNYSYVVEETGDEYHLEFTKADC